MESKSAKPGSLRPPTTNLGVRSSNLFGRASKNNYLAEKAVSKTELRVTLRVTADIIYLYGHFRLPRTAPTRRCSNRSCIYDGADPRTFQPLNPVPQS
jgi:hypothetical protein